MAADPAPREELHRLVDQLPEDAVEPVGWLLRRVQGTTDPDQAWFWSPEWLAGELEADQEIAAGKGVRYDSDEAFIASLEARVDAG